MIDTTVLLAIVSLVGTTLSLYFGYQNQNAKLKHDARLKVIENDLTHTVAQLEMTRSELAETKRELEKVKKEKIDLEKRVVDLEEHNGMLETEKRDWNAERRTLLEENAELKARMLVDVKRPRREL